MAVFLAVLSTLFTSIGQLMWKIGSDNLSLDPFSIIPSFYILFGFIIYGIALLFLLVALKQGELSVVYPLISLGFVWVLILSNYFLGEEAGIVKISGIIFIIIGIVTINVKNGN